MHTGARVLSWLHIGDLHVTEPDGQNLSDLRRIVALANDLPPGSLDFAVLPGDNADDGSDDQFRLVRDAVTPLRLKLHILPGDHDFKPANLAAFYRGLPARTLPYATATQGHRCLFLDVVSAGRGGPDFRLDDAQLDWIERELSDDVPTVVFMHTYPADLRQGGERLGRLLAHPQVRCVDMGHTHYNELANDGGTIFMATRSTGQIEEGPPGFSIAAIDGDCVSWRFIPLAQPWPVVLVTRPADQRLATRLNRTDPGTLLVRAKILSDAPVRTVEVSVDFRPWAPMTQVPGQAALWQANVKTGPATISVRVIDARGRTDQDTIEPAPPDWTAPQRIADGSDRDRVGAWPERHILGSQLGPNRNGRAW